MSSSDSQRGVRRQGTGDVFFLRIDDPPGLAAYLRERGWLADGEDVPTVAPAGDGNMNCTIRVVTPTERLIVKQGRPWVEKYPQIPAPEERTLVEAAFYETVAPVAAIADWMPTLVGIDRDDRVLAMRDCVGFADLTGLYERGKIDVAVLDALLAYLAALHRVPVSDATVAPFANDAMRTLNHAYIFALPLVPDAGLAARLDGLTPGLATLAQQLMADTAYAAEARRLGEIYLHGAPRALVHGDYFPGSWLANGADIAVIDPEFCFAGAPEFDYGVMAAHLILAGQNETTVARVVDAAVAAGLDTALVHGFAGVEIMRRLIGVAQLPRLVRSLEAKAALLERSRQLVLGLAPLA